MADIQFQLDEHVAHAIAHGLQRRGIPALTPADARLRGAPDVEYLARCLQEKRILLTNDHDFLTLNGAGHPHAGIAYWEQGTQTIGHILLLQLMYELYQAEEMVGHVEYL